MIREGFFSPDPSADRGFFLGGFPLISLSKRRTTLGSVLHRLSHRHTFPSPPVTADSKRVAGPLKPWESRACGHLSESALSFKTTNSNIRWVRDHKRHRRKECSPDRPMNPPHCCQKPSFNNSVLKPNRNAVVFGATSFCTILHATHSLFLPLSPSHPV